MASHVTHLEAAIDGTRYPARALHSTHEGRPLWVRYDLAAIERAVKRDDLAARQPTMWRYREFLPVERDEDIVSLGETMTPLLRCDRLARAMGVEQLFIKDESRLPTGSFKARGMAMAVSMAKSLGLKRIALPTAGNAGGAAAAYAARAGMECFVFMPHDTPIVNRLEAALHGARVFLVNGLIHDCGRLVGEGREAMNWFDFSTLKEPYRLEGKKTMGLELAEQFGWRLPDVVLYPTGGGTGLIGMWKAWEELAAVHWLKGDRRPRLYACQSSGCAPIPAAFDAGQRFAAPPTSPHTLASGLRVPRAVGDFMILDAVRASGGRAVAADESRLIQWMRLGCELEGIALCPESAAGLDVLEQGLRAGWIRPDERIVLFNTGAVQKYVEVMEQDVEFVSLDCHKPVDWARLVG